MRGSAPVFQKNQDPAKGPALWNPTLEQEFGDKPPSAMRAACPSGEDKPHSGF